MTKTRLFLAGNLPESWLTSFRAAGPELRKITRKMSQTKVGNEHLTWAFLGELDAEQVALAEEALDRAFMMLKEDHGFRADLCTVAFSHWTAQARGKRDGYLVRADLEANALHRLAVSCVQGALREAGISLDARPWLPHMTLARRVDWKEGGPGDLPLVGEGEPVSLVSLSLYESAFTTEGMRYTERLIWH